MGEDESIPRESSDESAGEETLEESVEISEPVLDETTEVTDEGQTDGAAKGEVRDSDEGADDKPVTMEPELEPREDMEDDSSMLLGHHRDSGEEVRMNPSVLTRHAAMLGSTGSGKTVMAKTLIEEATLANIPSLILDPQGDLARLCLGVDEEVLEEKGGDKARAVRLMEKAEVRIWTPLRSKGIPLCIDPFQPPPNGLDFEEAITAWDMVAAGFTALAQYDMDKPQGKQVRPYLYEVLVHSDRIGLHLTDFRSLAKASRDPHGTLIAHLAPVEDEEEGDVEIEWDDISDQYDLPNFEEMLPKSTREELSRRLAAFASGVNQLLFSNGVPIDPEIFTKPVTEGKIPLNVVYLNTIQDEAQKHYFVQEIARSLYDWMLAKDPSGGELELLFFMDEVAPYLPPHPRNPPAKDLIKLIFKQARKYGVAAILATQNASDVDYKILAQANSAFIGRFKEPQDIDRVKHLLKESGSDSSLVDDLPTLGPGQFQLVAPDVSTTPIPLQCRWLYTDHGSPFSEDQVEEHTLEEHREWAKKFSSGSKRSSKGARDNSAARAATGAKGLKAAAVRGVGSAGLTGLAAAASGIDTDEEAFEVRLMGGLSVLRDGRDPLYVMQGITNAASSLILTWVFVAMAIGWQSGSVDWWWTLLALAISGVVLSVTALELFLSHDAELMNKISRFARHIQYVLAAWLWILLLWDRIGALELPKLLSPFLEAVVVWVSLFIIVEWVNRVRLGKLEWKKSEETSWGNISDGMRSLTAIFTQAEFQDIRSNSKQVLSGVRWVLDFFTLLFFLTVSWVALAASNKGIALAESLDGLGGESFLVKPALWLGSLYLLIFIAETWLRIKSKE